MDYYNNKFPGDSNEDSSKQQSCDYIDNFTFNQIECLIQQQVFFYKITKINSTEY
jgi:hypothetical protein